MISQMSKVVAVLQHMYTNQLTSLPHSLPLSGSTAGHLLVEDAHSVV